MSTSLIDATAQRPSRAATELMAKANELRAMAPTARSLDVVAALLRLADRYENAAKARIGSGPANADKCLVVSSENGTRQVRAGASR